MNSDNTTAGSPHGYRSARWLNRPLLFRAGDGRALNVVFVILKRLVWSAVITVVRVPVTLAARASTVEGTCPICYFIPHTGSCSLAANGPERLLLVAAATTPVIYTLVGVAVDIRVASAAVNYLITSPIRSRILTVTDYGKKQIHGALGKPFAVNSTLWHRRKRGENYSQSCYRFGNLCPRHASRRRLETCSLQYK